MKRKHGNDRVMLKGQLIKHKEVEGLSSAGLRDGGGGPVLSCVCRDSISGWRKACDF